MGNRVACLQAEPEQREARESSVEPFRQALRNRWWNTASEELRRRNYSSSLVDEYITALEHDDSFTISFYILLHCNTEQLDRVLATATKKDCGLWQARC
jgi:hypothetical protein